MLNVLHQGQVLIRYEVFMCLIFPATRWDVACFSLLPYYCSLPLPHTTQAVMIVLGRARIGKLCRKMTLGLPVRRREGWFERKDAPEFPAEDIGAKWSWGRVRHFLQNKMIYGVISRRSELQGDAPIRKADCFRRDGENTLYSGFWLMSAPR